ncbi:uncharacterized protein BKA55DRAFT_686539 [Fusarium redolens]|uniref:Uncharacterized protein n=1 Tax=Fusarium redolens TaxID=48865 RepID=A0A9P9HPI9_FUSRE|nr:uncharacterized protein BKA55DRAFT_686539 [Fusarium redolens]KAH7260961.1 hypothetical protein BKA55DRAFT_686539 [Fusarium redolens]
MAAHSPQLNRRGSVDQLFELVEGLDETQIHTLLEDFNNTVTSNIPVSHGIDFFEHPTTGVSKTKTTPVRSSSIRKSFKQLPRLFTRTPSKRAVSAPIARPKTAAPTTKHYRRISRPVLPTLSSGPDLDALLSAYLAPAPPPSSSHKTISPSRSISSNSTLSLEAEDSGVDSLAPLVFGRPQREASPMGDIMEVLSF